MWENIRYIKHRGNSWSQTSETNKEYFAEILIKFLQTDNQTAMDIWSSTENTDMIRQCPRRSLFAHNSK